MKENELSLKSISDIDRNFKVANDIKIDGLGFCDCRENPFKVYGVFYENGKFRRMPEKTAKTVSDGVYFLHTNTAGGRVRFKTDSQRIAILAEMENIEKAPHFAFAGSAGFDMYVDTTYVKTFIPPINIETQLLSEHKFDSKELRSITINFPLYTDVKELYIGIEKDSTVEAAEPYCNEKPVVYYGSSITQGGCASRPGMCYQAIISRRFNCDYINLGFSGNAKAEDEIADYIKNLDMSVFVYDYDHNAPSKEHLEKTHEKMFRAVRSIHPNIPIIIMSRPKYYLSEEEKERRSIIETTYKNALLSGDKNVYFIDGKKLTDLCKNEGTVDNCHPTDFGFASMAKALGDVLENVKVI